MAFYAGYIHQRHHFRVYCLYFASKQYLVTEHSVLPVHNLYNKRRYVCLSVCLSVPMFRMAGQTAGLIETKLDTRTHVHPGSVSVNANVKVIHVCVRE